MSNKAQELFAAVSTGSVVEELPQERQQGRWVPVSERLPEMKQPVLACTYGCVDYWIVERCEVYGKEGWFWADLDEWDFEPDRFTHWMALPLPPKEEPTK